jgi:hypothetical protein
MELWTIYAWLLELLFFSIRIYSGENRNVMKVTVSLCFQIMATVSKESIKYVITGIRSILNNSFLKVKCLWLSENNCKKINCINFSAFLLKISSNYKGYGIP